MTLPTETKKKVKVEFSALPTSEHEEQSAFFDYATTFTIQDYPEVHPLLFATLNGIPLGGSVRQRAITINKMKRAGLVPGTPDVLFMSGRGGYFGLAMEFKTVERRNTENGGLSETQQEFMYSARMEGMKTAVAHGADDGIKVLNDYLSMPRTQDMVYKALRFLETNNAEAAKLILKEITLAWD